MKTYLIILTFLISSLAHAYEDVRWKSHQKGLQFISLHSEGARYFVDHFELADGQIQERINEISFQTFEEAEEYFLKHTTGFELIRPHSESEFVRTEDPHQVLWPTLNHWDQTWEDRFSEWIESEVNADFLLKHKIAVDCADVPISLRWIFARTHGLEIEIHLAGSGVVFSNSSFRQAWKDLPTAEEWHQDELFLAALDFVLRNTYTQSLIHDLYPISITQDHLRGGVVFLNLYNDVTGHAELVRNVIYKQDHPSPLRIIAGTVPRQLRSLVEYGFRPWEGRLQEFRHGFYRFKWPSSERSEMPGFSLEQFDPKFTVGFRDYSHAVIARLIPGWKPNLQEMMKTLMALALERFQLRVQVVLDGYNHCTQIGGCVEGSQDWEAWSTPSRDNAILSVQRDIYTLVNDSKCNYNCRREYLSKIKTVVTTVDRRRLNLGDALEIWQLKKFTSNPNDPVRIRWGL